MKTILFLILATMASPNLCAQMVTGPWIKLPYPGMKMTGGYMVIKNDTNQEISLQRVSGSDCESYEIHTHEMKDGVMKMRQIPELKIKAHGSVELKPKSYHIMMIQLKEALKEGSLRKMTLHFSNGKKLLVDVPVKRLE